MAFVGFRVPAEAASLLAGVEVPGERHSASDMHLTSLFLGRDVPVVILAKAMIALHRVCQGSGPIEVSLTDISSFPGNEDGVPVICPAESPGLHSFRSSLAAAFDSLGIPYSKRWPEYKPHVTLSYVKDGSSTEVTGSLPGPVNFYLYEAVLWGGDDRFGGVRVESPLSLSPTVHMARRLAGLCG